MNKILPLIGIDIGFGQAKGCSLDGREFKVPSWTARVHDRSLDMNKTAVLVDGSQNWLVGEDAHKMARATIPTVDSLYYETDEYRIMFRHILEQFGVREARIVTGLPVRYLKSHRDRLKATLLDWRKYSLHLDVVAVVAQPVGSMFYLNFGPDGKARSELAKGRTGIVDIGGGTVDAIELNDGAVSWTTHASEPRGVNRAYEYLHSYVRSKNIMARITDMRKAIQTGTIRDGKNDVSLERPIADAKRLVVQAVSDIVLDLWGSANSLDHLVVTGGGAAFIRTELEAEFKKARLVIPDEPDMANVRGYVRVGQMMKMQDGDK